LWSYDRRHVEAALMVHEADLRELDEALPHLYVTLRTGVEWSRRGIMVADGVSRAISVAQLGVAAALEGPSHGNGRRWAEVWGGEAEVLRRRRRLPARRGAPALLPLALQVQGDDLPERQPPARREPPPRR